MNYYEYYVKSLEKLKNSGVSYEDALSCLEFDSDEYPDMAVLKQALDEVYGPN